MVQECRKDLNSCIVFSSLVSYKVQCLLLFALVSRYKRRGRAHDSPSGVMIGLSRGGGSCCIRRQTLFS